jgi:hypothetical protein
MKNTPYQIQLADALYRALNSHCALAQCQGEAWIHRLQDSAVLEL